MQAKPTLSVVINYQINRRLSEKSQNRFCIINFVKAQGL